MVQWSEFDVANVAIRVRFPVGANIYIYMNKYIYKKIYIYFSAGSEIRTRDPLLTRQMQ